MNIRSVGLATELGLLATRGQILDRGDYLVVRTPDDPSSYYSNALVLSSPPQAGQVAYWTRRFHEELGDNPEIRHVTLCWDGTTGDTGAANELIAAGFVIENQQVMVATALPSLDRPLELRTLGPDELIAVSELAYALSDRHDEAHRRFLARRAAWQSQLIERGLAEFWGAFDSGDLVASLGLVTLDHRGRYQDVQTVASHRNRGIASALLVSAGQRALAHDVDQLVIVAIPGTPAARVYERIGFRTIERTASACHYPATSG